MVIIVVSMVAVPVAHGDCCSVVLCGCVIVWLISRGKKYLGKNYIYLGKNHIYLGQNNISRKKECQSSREKRVTVSREKEDYSRIQSKALELECHPSLFFHAPTKGIS
jgi:hypothetical protein